jgi:hypothetical protein
MRVAAPAPAPATVTVVLLLPAAVVVVVVRVAPVMVVTVGGVMCAPAPAASERLGDPSVARGGGVASGAHLPGRLRGGPRHALLVLTP